MLDVRGLWKVFEGPTGRTEVLRGVGLHVARGACVGIAGPSGSGKTTLLQLIAGLDVATAGRVELDFVSVLELDARARARLRLRSLGIVFSEHNLCPALTAEENVDLKLAWLGVTSAERRARVQEALESVGLAGKAGRRPAELSAGEQQRAAVARALAGSPTLVLADEPTSHLDAAAAAHLTDLLVANARAASAALVVASHDSAVLSKLDSVRELRDGKLT